MDPQYHQRPQIQQNLRTQVETARFDQEEAHRQHAAARDEQLLDLTTEMRDLTGSIRRLTGRRDYCRQCARLFCRRIDPHHHPWRLTL